MAKITTKTSVKLNTSKSVRGTKTSINLPNNEEALDEVEQLEAKVLSKPEAKAKPKLNVIWPILLVFAILCCVGLPFIPFAERILVGSILASQAIFALYKIFKFEKDTTKWYIDNPEFMPVKKKKSHKTLKR